MHPKQETRDILWNKPPYTSDRGERGEFQQQERKYNPPLMKLKERINKTTNKKIKKQPRSTQDRHIKSTAIYRKQRTGKEPQHGISKACSKHTKHKNQNKIKTEKQFYILSI